MGTQILGEEVTLYLRAKLTVSVTAASVTVT